MNKEKWDSYFKFVFVRNPYNKIVSAYNFLKTYKQYKQKDNDTVHLNNFKDFIDNSNNLSNFAYFHSFITQYDNLIDYDDKITFNYIAYFENIEDELNIILHKIGINDLIHLKDNDNNLMKLKRRKNESNKEFKRTVDYFDESTFKKVNEMFNQDFIYFKYKKYDTYLDFVQNT
jgi:hypothetical protein